MAKFLVVVLSIALTGVFAEPPSSYLPPQARNQQPSSRYGAPNGRFGQQPDSQYGAPARSGPVGPSSFRAPQNGNGSGRSFSYNSIAESQFGGSSRRNGQSSLRGRTFGQQPAPFSAPSNGFGPARNNGGSYSNAPSQRYGAPSAPAPQYGAPSQQYSPPRNFAPQPSSQYGAPAPRYGAPSTEYGAPNARKMDDDLAEPANYEYNYEVQAAEESGAEFGHQESREEDFARGEYHVLLPDGRMQIVEYEADEEGYRPQIRYEETGAYPEARNNQGPY